MATEVVTPGEVEVVHEPAHGVGLVRWLTTVHHTDIGVMYIVTSYGFFLIGGLLALLMRVELTTPQGDFIGPDTYNSLFTIHGTTMIFLFAVPVMTGFANYFVPLLIKAPDMAFPRVNALGYWLIPPAGAMIWFGSANIGWTGYPPFSLSTFTPGYGVDLWILGLQILGISSIIASINIIVTILKMRAPGITFRNLDLFVWAALVTAWMLLLAAPVLASAVTLLFLDRNLGTCFYNTAPPNCTGQGDPILWQHLFWFFGHPEVYIMVLPAMGMISAVLPAMVKKPIFGYRAIAWSSVAIGAMGFGVWAHHMFTTGLDLRVRIPFMLVTMAIAVPSGVKIFNWLATIWGGEVRFFTPMLFVIGFLTMFTIGGVSGIYLASIPIDYQVQDTYFVVAHLHYVLFGGTVMGLFAGTYYWFPRITGRMYSEALGKLHFLSTMIGMNLVFFPMHFMGLWGMPRRVYSYQPEFAAMNVVATVGSFILGVGQVFLFANLLWSAWRGRPAPADPWE
jgi:cytochrome c oxidase subunit 1